MTTPPLAFIKTAGDKPVGVKNFTPVRRACNGSIGQIATCNSSLSRVQVTGLEKATLAEVKKAAFQESSAPGYNARQVGLALYELGRRSHQKLDMGSAERAYAESFKLGCPEGAFALACLYTGGDGVAQDIGKGVAILEQGLDMLDDDSDPGLAFSIQSALGLAKSLCECALSSLHLGLRKAERCDHALQPPRT